jgi:diguanylate cyclase (GGDEF)-like protein/PAS domain S-box-containing protein
MMNTFNALMPHGFCINWTPSLLWSYVIADALIAFAYYTIPVTLAWFVWRRKDLEFRWIFLLFGAFIFACGTTHLLSIVLLWQPVYWLDVSMKMATAGISVVAAICLAWVVPKALRLPSPAELEAEIRIRQETQHSLQESESRLRTWVAQLNTLTEALPDAIFLKDGDGRWLVTNEPAKKLFRLHDIAWQGKTDMELASLHPEMRELHETCFADDEAAWNAGKLAIFERHFIDLQEGLREFEVRRAPIFRPDGQRKGMVIISRDVTDSKRAEQQLRIADTAIESQEGIIVTDAANHILRVNRAFTRLTGYTPEEVIGKTPAILKSGRHDKEFYRAMWEVLNAERFWQGEVWDRRKNGEIYPKWLTITAVSGPGGEITNYVGAFTDLSQHKDAEEAIYRLAFYDPLTDLPNRRLLRDRLQLSQKSGNRSNQYGAVLLIDLDNFKAINDTMGHETGDLLLIESAKRLQACVRQGDTVARLGGDEFVIMLENLGTDTTQAAAKAEAIGEKVLEAINRPFLLAGQEHHSSPSIGACLFHNHNDSTEEILKRADAAMYQAKHGGRNTMRFFDPAMQASLETRMSMETDLRHALQKSQLRLYYQAQVDRSSHIFGAEVLLRWEHPRRGCVAPSQFIPLAEETGLILPIGGWVLHNACMQLKSWESDPRARNLVLAVNVSARQFRQTDFVEQVCKALKETGIDSTRLKLELTESLVLHNVSDAIEKMQALRLLGIRFSMDDFGTGYSSLSYLKKLPLAQLKIDQSFIRDIASDQSDAIIAQTIIGMADNLGLNVIAEGVESEEQRALLESYGCAAFQGYLFSKPIPVEQFEKLIAHGVRTRHPG